MSIVGPTNRKRYRCPLCVGGEIAPETEHYGLEPLWWCTDCEDAYLEVENQNKRYQREELFVIAGRIFLLQVRPF